MEEMDMNASANPLAAFAPGLARGCARLLAGLLVLSCVPAMAASSRTGGAPARTPGSRPDLLAVAGATGSGVACGRGVVLYSATTHQTWFTSAGFDSEATYTAAVRTSGGYLIADESGAIWRSTDPTGSAFALAAHAAGHPLRGLALLQSGSGVLAVGDQGTVLKSFDQTGGSWTAQVSPVSTNLRAVLVTATSAVAVGDGGIILRGSPQGTDWVQAESKTAKNLLALARNQFGQFLAVGTDGVALRGEPDGLTWTLLDPIGSTTLRGAAQVASSNQVVVVGDGGEIFLSPGGYANWESAVAPSPLNLYAVVWTGTDLVAGGSRTLVLWSYRGTSWTLPVIPVEQTTWGVVKQRFSRGR
jgi:photosystem II stability/assembly factor-like uncharacterized protein